MNRSVAIISGFTLIELSLVLVIIGLLVGGVLVGRDLVRSAEVRAQISQIQRYQTAVNTFRSKYSYLPGDIPDPDASKFGFVARGANPGQGDGNGVITSPHSCFTTADVPTPLSDGEGVVLWTDLSSANLINERMVTGSETVAYTVTGTTISNLLPVSKIGNSYVYVFSGGAASSDPCRGVDNYNYFGISTISYFSYNNMIAGSGFAVAQASAIDSKIDDGLPQSGTVVALVGGSQWSAGGYTTGSGGGGTAGALPGTAASASSTSCYDNSGNAANSMVYSITQNNGSGVNCSLSFRFQ